MPDRTAYTAAWMRLSICSFIRMFEMWFLTVFGLMCSSAAMTALSLPFAISFSTSISRSESSARIVSAISGRSLVARTREDRVHHVTVLIRDRQHHDARQRRDRRDVPRRLDAAHPRHVQVHDDDVGRELAHHPDGVGAGAGLAHDLDPLLLE